MITKYLHKIFSYSKIKPVQNWSTLEEDIVDESICPAEDFDKLCLDITNDHDEKDFTIVNTD